MDQEGRIRRLKNRNMYSVRTADPKVTMLLRGDVSLEWPVGSEIGVRVSELFQKQAKEVHVKNHPTPDEPA